MKRSPLILLVLAAVIFLAGCAASVPLAPKEADADAKQFAPAGDGGNLYIVRRGGSVGMAILCTVAVDNKLEGGLAVGTYRVLQLPPGRVSVSAFGNESQDTATINVPAGGNVFVEVFEKTGWASARFGLKKLTEEAGRKVVTKSRLAENMAARDLDATDSPEPAGRR